MGNATATTVGTDVSAGALILLLFFVIWAWARLGGIQKYLDKALHPTKQDLIDRIRNQTVNNEFLVNDPASRRALFDYVLSEAAVAMALKDVGTAFEDHLNNGGTLDSAQAVEAVREEYETPPQKDQTWWNRFCGFVSENKWDIAKGLLGKVNGLVTGNIKIFGGQGN